MRSHPLPIAWLARSRDARTLHPDIADVLDFIDGTLDTQP
jgi:hypothetical protein